MSVLNWLKNNKRSLGAMTIGSIVAMVIVIYSFSYAALLFSGPLRFGLVIGVTASFISLIIGGGIIIVLSKNKYIVAGPDSNATAIIALMLSNLTALMLSQHYPQEMIISATIIMLFVATFSTALIYFIVGYFKLTTFIKLVPYPVIAGFLAATGWLYILGALRILSNENISFDNFIHLFHDIHSTLLFALSVIVAILLFAEQITARRFYLFFSILITAFIGFYLVLFLTQTSVSEAQNYGWLFNPEVHSEISRWPWKHLNFAAFDLKIFIELIPNLTIVIFVALVTLLLNYTSIESYTNREVDLDFETKNHGIANLVIAFCFGFVSYTSATKSILNYELGARTKSASITAIVIATLFLFFGINSIYYMPKFIMSGLLTCLGLILIYRSLIVSYGSLPRLEYYMVLAITFAIIVLGFAYGIVLGIILGCFIFIYNYYRKMTFISSVSTLKNYRSQTTRPLSESKVLDEFGDQCIILRLQGYLFFAMAHQLTQYFHQHILNKKIKYLILDLTNTNGVDASVYVAISLLAKISEEMRIKFYITGVNMRKHPGYYARMEKYSNVVIYKKFNQTVQTIENEIIAKREQHNIERLSLQEWLSQEFNDRDKASEFIQHLSKRHYKTHEYLKDYKDYELRIIFLDKGHVSLKIQRDEHDKPTFIRDIADQTIIGELSFFTKKISDVTVKALSDVETYELSYDEFIRMKEEKPELITCLYEMVIRTISERVYMGNKLLMSVLKIDKDNNL